MRCYQIFEFESGYKNVLLLNHLSLRVSQTGGLGCILIQAIQYIQRALDPLVGVLLVQGRLGLIDLLDILEMSMSDTINASYVTMVRGIHSSV